MHGVYVLTSKKDNSLYIGYARDIKKRLAEHNGGKVSSTKAKRPYRLIYCELFLNQKDAMRRELYFKSGWGRKYLAKILTYTLQDMDKNFSG